jgi:hypothetical protein
MLEARNFVSDLDNARRILAEQKAEYKGEYLIHDIIFRSKDSRRTLNDDFLRLRLVPKNIWEDKGVILAIKNTELKSVGKNSVIPLKLQFDTETEARDYYTKNLADKYTYDFEFNRKGWQYFIGTEGVDLEDIEGHRSIEVKSETEEGLKKLTELFGMKNIIKGPSVVAVKTILNR